MFSFKFDFKFVLVFIGLFFLGVFVWQKQMTPEPQSEKLVVGMMNGWPPFMSINQAGEMEGFDVDVAQLVAQRLGRKLEIRDLGSVQTIFIALEQGIIDLAMSAFDMTQERMKVYNMVKYTSREYLSVMILFWKQVPTGIKSLQDVICAGIRVAVEPGSGQEKYLDTFKNVSKVTIPAMQDLVMELRFGKAGAGLVEPSVARRLEKQTPELVFIEQKLPTEFKVIGDGITLKKNNLTLTAEVTKVIEQLKKEGILQQLEAKWQIDGGA